MKKKYFVTSKDKKDWTAFTKQMGNISAKESDILKENIEELHIVAKGLLEYETLTGEEIKDLVKGIKPSRDDFDEGATTKETITSSVPKTGDSTAPQVN